MAEKTYIDREEVEKNIDELKGYLDDKSIKTIKMAIRGILPDDDVVHVVRCRDCIYSPFDCNSNRYESDYCKLRCRRIHQNDFCSYGERKGLDNGNV